MTGSFSVGPPSPRGARAVALGLVLLTLAAFLPVVRNNFVLYDDQDYITQNARIRQGITADTVVWAFTTFQTGSWHPVTWLSHLADGQLYGLNPAGHHATSLLIHTATAAALFLVFRGLTGALWPSALVAALFAIHPLHVESVAWGSERKDVLAGFFWVLTMGAYLRHARHPGLRRYLPLLVCFALGLMSKPLLVTLPFLLMVLDFWPLGRWQPVGGGTPPAGPVRAAGRLLLEKAPLIGLSAALSFVTYYAQLQIGAVSAVPGHTPVKRIGNALVSYLLYLEKTFWPSNLSVFYPYHMQRQSDWVIAAAVLGAATAAVAWAARTRPYLIVGWLWFIGTLVPMIGLVQVGSQGLADRYSYVPLIGIFLLGTWGVADLARRAPSLRRHAAAAAVILLATLLALTSRQVLYWRSTVTLFRHAVAVTPDNYQAKILLGRGLTREGMLEEANEWFRSALRINPGFKQLNNLIGINLYHRGKLREAADHLLEETRIDPGNPAPRVYLGTIFKELGQNEEARGYFREVLRIEPENARILTSLGFLYASDGLWPEALSCFEQALRITPDDPAARARAKEAAIRVRGR